VRIDGCSIADAFGSIYRSDEINNLSDELMAELGRDEKILEKIGSQDLPPNEVTMISHSHPPVNCSIIVLGSSDHQQDSSCDTEPLGKKYAGQTRPSDSWFGQYYSQADSNSRSW
jgi:hypothetical protein